MDWGTSWPRSSRFRTVTVTDSRAVPSSTEMEGVTAANGVVCAKAATVGASAAKAQAIPTARNMNGAAEWRCNRFWFMILGTFLCGYWNRLADVNDT